MISTIFYSCQIPERLFPGRFDIIGYGHQVFHVTMAYTTCLQFRAAAWEIQTRPRELYEMSKPTFWGIFGTLLFVLVADVLFVLFTHKERIRRASIARSDFLRSGANNLQNGQLSEARKEK